MYRTQPSPPPSIESFEFPNGGVLSGENRWVKLAALIPWQEYESRYAEQFSEGQGAPAKGFRVALGALIIKARLGASDRECVEQIRENPYLQYFLGMSESSNQAAFDASMYVHFCKRISVELVMQLNEFIGEQGIKE
jgi:hypothetical protein